MKTVMQYLEERRRSTNRVLYCCDKLSTVDETYKRESAEAMRDLEIIEELIVLVKKQEQETRSALNYRAFLQSLNDLKSGNVQMVRRDGVLIDEQYMMHHTLFPYIGQRVVVYGKAVLYHGVLIHAF